MQVRSRMPGGIIRSYTPRMVLLLPFAFAADLTWPVLELSASTRNFGLVPLGSSAFDSVEVRNGGDLPMGLRVELVAQPSADFSFSWDTTACDSGTPLLPGAELQADTGGSQSAWEDEAEPGADAALPAGCSVTIYLGYAPTEGGEALGALVLTTSGDYPHGRSDFQTELPGYAEDPVEVRRVVTLKGRTDGEAPGNSGPAILAVDASPDVCREGESVKLQAWSVDPDGGGMAYIWGTDSERGPDLLDNLYGLGPTFTCPAVDAECGSEEVVVYLLATDQDGHEAWGDTRVWVIDERRDRTEAFVAGQDSCRPASTSDEPERPCGCAHSAAGLPLAMAAGVIASRRREPRAQRR